VLLHGLLAGGGERLYLAAVIDARYLAAPTRVATRCRRICVMSATRVVAGCRRSVAGRRAHSCSNMPSPAATRPSAGAMERTTIDPPLCACRSTRARRVERTVIATQSESYALAPTAQPAAPSLDRRHHAVLALALGRAPGAAFRRAARAAAAGTRRIARQDFSAQIPVQGRDEIAQLTRAHNEMARDSA